MSDLDGLVVVVTGAAGPAGVAACTALRAAGATVVAVGHSPQRLAALADRIPGLQVEAVDLADADAVTALAARVREGRGRVDGLIHLVGGWRGGDTFTANSDSDWLFLSTSLIDTLRHTTLAFHDDLVRAPAGRVAIVSARAAAKPSAGSANYAAAKAAAEAWMLALADSFRRSAPDSPDDGAAAVIFVIKALVTDQMRAESPDRRFPGFTDVADLADRIVELWVADSADLNGARITLDA
jgi:3-oxoacyl-[acyl-carrier protein] reductase